jgi:hypothetical protein
MAAKHVIYVGDTGLCFVMTGTKTIVVHQTGAFLVKNNHRNYSRQLERLRKMIRRRQIRSIVDLVDYCKYGPANYKNQMAGLELIPTKLEYYL